jgi:hypothetical protein
MSTHPSDSNSLHISPDILVNQMQNIALSPSSATGTASSDNSLSSVRPFVSYTQAQILSLYKSPLVAPPRGMPVLKDWFGYAIPFISFSIFGISSLRDWNEQNASKKDSDTSAATSGARDKRCVLLRASSAATIFSPLLASGVTRKMLVHSSSPPLYSFVHSPLPQRSFPHAPPSDQRHLSPRKWGILSINPFAPVSVKKIRTRTEIVNVTSGIKKARSEFVV